MDRIVIIVKDVVLGTSTNLEASPLFVLLDNAIANDKIVVLSLKDCSPMSSSFLNSSIGELVDKYGISLLKDKLIITDYTPAVAKSLQDYISRLKELVC